MRTWVVGIDGSEAGLDALRFAAERGAPTGTRLVVVHVRHLPGAWEERAMTAQAGATILEEIQREAHEGAARTLAGRGVDWEFDARAGDPADVLEAVAAERSAELIVVSGRAHSAVHKAVLGSVSSRLAQSASVSVLIVR